MCVCILTWNVCFRSFLTHFNYNMYNFLVSPFAHFLGRLHNSHVNEFRCRHCRCRRRRRRLYFVVLFAIVKIGNYVINRTRQIQFSSLLVSIVLLYLSLPFYLLSSCRRVSAFSASADEMNRTHFVCTILCKIKMFYALYAEKYISGEQWYTVNIEWYIIKILLESEDMWLERPPPLHR